MNIESIKASIKTLSDAYTARGIERELIVFPEPALPIQTTANAFIDAAVLTEALNGGWKPDYNDLAEERFSISWEMRSIAAGGPGFSCYAINQDNYHLATVGANMVFRRSDIAFYAATQFTEVYRPVMTLPGALV